MIKSKNLLIIFLIFLIFFGSAGFVQAMRGDHILYADPQLREEAGLPELPPPPTWLTAPTNTIRGWIQSLSNWMALPWFLLSIVASFIAILGLGLARLSIILLVWVLSPSFNQLSYTNPAGNPVIEYGLYITQGFVNIFLILILIYIALATILRIAGYRTKQLLVTFILVALLVNFAPVICGLVVDAANIVMYTFIVNLEQLFGWSESLGAVWLGITNERSWQEPTLMMNAFFLTMVLAGVSFMVAFIIFLYAILFIFRYVAIWILVILSPLAFLAYILPATRGIFSKWWSALIQWSFFGAIAGFFLYLGASLLNGMLNQDFFIAPIGQEGEDFDIIFPLLPSLVPVAFFYIGLIVAFQTSALGASTIINATRKSGKWARKKGWQGTKWTAKQTSNALKVPEAAVRVSDRLGESRLGSVIAPKISAWGKKEIDDRNKNLRNLSLAGEARKRGESVRQTMGRYSNRDFATKINERTIRNVGFDTVAGASLQQIQALGRTGSPSAKQAMVNMIQNNLHSAEAERSRLYSITIDPRRTPQEKDLAVNQLRELNAKIKFIQTHPSFHPRV